MCEQEKKSRIAWVKVLKLCYRTMGSPAPGGADEAAAAATSEATTTAIAASEI
jgi:hypothetical protein